MGSRPKQEIPTGCYPYLKEVRAKLPCLKNNIVIQIGAELAEQFKLILSEKRVPVQNQFPATNTDRFYTYPELDAPTIPPVMTTQSSANNTDKYISSPPEVDPGLVRYYERSYRCNAAIIAARELGLGIITTDDAQSTYGLVPDMDNLRHKDVIWLRYDGSLTDDLGTLNSSSGEEDTNSKKRFIKLCDEHDFPIPLSISHSFDIEELRRNLSNISNNSFFGSEQNSTSSFKNVFHVLAPSLFNDLYQAASQITYPLIVKPEHGSQGRNVAKIDNKNQLNDYLYALLTDINITSIKNLILQQYIEGPEYKITVLDDEVLYAYEKTGPGPIQKYKKEYCKEIDPADFSEELRNLLEELKMGLDLRYFSIDLKINNGVAYILEANCHPGVSYLHDHKGGNKAIIKLYKKIIKTIFDLRQSDKDKYNSAQYFPNPKK